MATFLKTKLIETHHKTILAYGFRPFTDDQIRFEQKTSQRTSFKIKYYF